MKQLKDYEWLCNRYKVGRYVFSDISYKEISRKHLLEGFITTLVGVKLLKNNDRKIYTI